jgi:hypothetical protein
MFSYPGRHFRGCIVTAVAIFIKTDIALGACNIEPTGELNVIDEGHELTLSADFRELEGRKSEITITVMYPQTELQEKYTTAIEQNIPKDHCGLDLARGQSEYALRHDGTIGVTTPIRVHAWLCGWGEYPCGGTLREPLRKCVWKWVDENINLRKTVYIHSNIAMKFTDEGGSELKPVAGVSPSESKFAKTFVQSNVDGDLSAIEEVVYNLIRFVAHAVTDISFRAIDLATAIDNLFPRIPLVTEDIKNSLKRDNFDPRFIEMRFVDFHGVYAARVKMRDERKCSVAREIRAVLVQMAKSSERERSGVVHHEVMKNDNLSAISEEYYGSAEFYPLIGYYNHVEDWNLLRLGSTIDIPTVERLRNDSNYVEPGESLWGIATAENAFNEAWYVAAVRQKRAEGRSPDKLVV